jgi:hypothetical protein
MVERLSCRVTAEVREGIWDYGMTLSLKKGSLAKAYRELLALAFAEPDAPIEWFEGEEEQSCTFDAASPEIAKLDQYQIHHRIGERRKGFKSALLRGYSIHRAQARQTA